MTLISQCIQYLYLVFIIVFCTEKNALLLIHVIAQCIVIVRQQFTSVWSGMPVG